MDARLPADAGPPDAGRLDAPPPPDATPPDLDGDGVLNEADCAPLDPLLQIVLANGACVADDTDDDDDGMPDALDCAPLDATRSILLLGGACVADDDDDDDDNDGVADVADCAPLDALHAVTLVTGACVADDLDDDNDGRFDGTDCAPLDPSLQVALVTGECVPNDGDDDNDGRLDALDCAPLDPALQVLLTTGACVADDDDNDDDGVLDATDCAPLDPARQILLETGSCVADDADDDNDSVDDLGDCSPRDGRYQMGSCVPGDSDTRACGTDEGTCQVGSQERACAENCYWPPWGECGSAVAPVIEVCGTSQDEDCDGLVDEGCGCAPVAPGAAGAIAIPGHLYNLTADPTRCFIYAMNDTPQQEFVVIDTLSKAEVARIPIASVSPGTPAARDFALSWNGTYLVLARNDVAELDVIYPPDWTVVPFDTGTLPRTVTVRSDGRAYYGNSSLRTIDLTTGVDELVYGALAGTFPLAMSPDDGRLYIGSSNLLRAYTSFPDGTIEWQSYSPPLLGINLSAGPIFAVSPDGRWLGWNRFLMDAQLPSFPRGRLAGNIFAFDASGRYGVSEGGVVDVELARVVGPIPGGTYSATLASSDEELWWHDASTGLLHYASIGDYLDPATIGQHERAPLPLAAHTYTHLESDPTRPWLYALDRYSSDLVILDRATLEPLLEIAVGSRPTDLALDPGGDTLYVGHYFTWGIGRIDLEDLSFAGLVPTFGQRATNVVAPRPDRALTTGYYGDPNTTGDFSHATLLDMANGVLLDKTTETFYETDLALGPGGSVFLGECASSGSNLIVLDASTDTLEVVRELPFLSQIDDTFEIFHYGIATIPGTTEVFWQGARWETNDLTRELDLEYWDEITAVTPHRALAISPWSIYDATTGAELMPLPVPTHSHAVSPDGHTLYVGLPGTIDTVDLTVYAADP